MQVLGKFSKDELQVIESDSAFEENRLYLVSELEKIKQGKAKFYTMEEAEERLEALYRKHEGRS